MTEEDLSTYPKSAKEARDLGASHYFTGKKCKNGHLSLRSVSCSKCLACDRERQASRRANPEKQEHLKALRLARYAKNRDKETALKRHLYATDPEYKAKVKERRYKSKYGIDFQRYDEILEIQDGVCAICKGEDFGRKGLERFLVDHCHDTDKVRGLVCNNCNSLNGFSREDTKLIQNAIKYLNEFELGADNISQ